MRRILVLRGGALGDFLVTLPALAALRQRWPSAQIELIGNATAAGLACSRHLIDRVHSQHEARWSALYAAQPLSTELRDWLAAFDLVISYWPDPDGDLARHFPVHQAQRFLQWPALPTRSPAAAHYAAVLQPLALSVEATFCLIEPDRVTPGAGRATLPIRTSRSIAIHPGSGSPRKNWPVSRWLEVIAAIADPIEVIVGAAEIETWNERLFAGTALEARLRDGTLKLATNLSLDEVVRVFGRCRFFLGHDSGISHLAAACGVPCLLLFGPTDPAMWAPPAPHVRVLQRGSACSPQLSPDLSSITVADVLAAARAHLERDGAAPAIRQVVS